MTHVGSLRVSPSSASARASALLLVGVLAMPAAAVDAPGERAVTALEVVFVPDDPSAPAVAVLVENDAKARRLRWVVGGARSGALAIGGALEDAPADRMPETPLLAPRAPVGASVAEREGGLVVTIDDAGAWQEALKALPKSKARGPAVADARALRLVVSSFSAGAPALLIGADVRLSGRAVVLRDLPPVLAVVAEPARVVVARPGVVAEAPACGGSIASAFSAPEDLLRLEAEPQAAVACTDALAIVRVVGVRTDPKKDVPVAGVAVLLRR